MGLRAASPTAAADADDDDAGGGSGDEPQAAERPCCDRQHTYQTGPGRRRHHVGCPHHHHAAQSSRRFDSMQVYYFHRNSRGTNEMFICHSGRTQKYKLVKTTRTRKLCYRKDDRAMRPTYGCPENFRDSLRHGHYSQYFHGLLL